LFILVIQCSPICSSLDYVERMEICVGGLADL